MPNRAGHPGRRYFVEGGTRHVGVQPKTPCIGSAGGAGARGRGLWRILAASAGFLLAGWAVRAGTIKGSKHDLSSTWTPDSMQVCIFCHSPHNANNTLGSINAPLWNRYVDRTKVYLVYTSLTMVTAPDNPTSTISAACLGCHDGTVGSATAYGTSGTDKMGLLNAPGLHESNVMENCTRCHDTLYGPVSKADLRFGLDLRNMHPIAVPYPTGALSGKFHPPPDAANGWQDVRLFNGRVECPTCHRPHNPDLVPFLAKSNDGSGLCLTCHIN